MNDLANCPKCNALFVQTQFRTVCADCYKIEEKQFETVYSFLRKRENRKAKIEEVVSGTEVAEELILKFIRLGRLQLSNFPNLGYPCEKCGNMIREGKLCSSCTKGLYDQLAQLQREEEHQRLMAHEEKKTYYSISPKK
ncbi:TIGR03826 family flagellar region protein [Metabacillus sp. FJAT-52054]|uniref:TIGR03826 family flagellar region protein n=1 Tax=Metabacillus sediminis TaxID=3117746 RepID=A0ABZ2NFK2_9BACI